MQTKSRKSRHGFTLIEILVVVAIIALLVAILLPSLARARDQAKTLRCLANLKQVGNTMAYYMNDNRSSFLPPFRFPINYEGLKNSSGRYDHPYWFQYLPFKYLANAFECVACPSDSKAVGSGRTGWRSVRGGNKLTYSYAMNDRLPIPATPASGSDMTRNPPYAQMWRMNLLQDYLERYQPTGVGHIKRPSQTVYLLETVGHNLMSGDSAPGEFRLDHGGRKDRQNVLMTDTHAENRDFLSIWHGDIAKKQSDLGQPSCPGRFNQLWYGSPTATSQIIY